MKKFGKILCALMLLGTMLCFTGCMRDVEDDEQITYTFKLTDDKISYVYFTSTDTFSFVDPEGIEQNPCCYQMSFNVGKKTWTLYARPVAQIKNLQTAASGTYDGASVTEEGKVTLYIGDEPYQTVEIRKNSSDELIFTCDVTIANKNLKASKAK